MTKTIELATARRLHITFNPAEKLISLSSEQEYSGIWSPEQQISLPEGKWNEIVQTVADELR